MTWRRSRSLGTVLTADLLIVGGGIAGLACAISAKETDPEVDVLVLDKVVAGWGGKANKGGGNIVFMDPADGFDNVLDFHVHNVGDFLEDQELLLDFAQGVAAQPRAPRALGRAHLPRRRRRAQVRALAAGASLAPGGARPGPHAQHGQARAQAGRALQGSRRDHRPAQGRRARLRRHRLRHDRRRVRDRPGRRRRAGQRQPVLQADASLGERGWRGYRRRVPRRCGDARRRVRQLHQLGLRRHQGSLPGRGGRALQRQGREHLQARAPDARVGRPLQGGRGVVEGDEGRQRSHRRQHDRELREQRDRAGVPRGQARRPSGLDEVLGPHDRQGHGRLDGPGTDAAGHARSQRRARAGQGRPPDGDHAAGPLRHRRHVLRRDLPRRRRAGSPRPHARLGPRLRHVLRRPLRAGGGGRGPGRLRSPGRRAGGGAQGEDLRAARAAPAWRRRRWSARSRTSWRRSATASTSAPTG